MRSRILAALVIGASAIASCGDAPADENDAAETEASRPLGPDSITLGMPPSSNPDIPTGGVDPEVQGELVTVRIGAGGLELARDTIPAGQVTIQAENGQEQTCALEVRSATGGLWRSVPIRQNGSAGLSMVLSRSPYYVTCALQGGGGAFANDTARLIVR